MGELSGAAGCRAVMVKVPPEHAAEYVYPSRPPHGISTELEDIRSSTGAQFPFNAIWLSSAWAISSRSARTPVRVMACVGDVPSSELGIF